MPNRAAGGVRESRVRPPRVARVGGDVETVFFSGVAVAVEAVVKEDEEKEEDEGDGGGELVRTKVSTRS